MKTLTRMYLPSKYADLLMATKVSDYIVDEDLSLFSGQKVYAIDSSGEFEEIGPLSSISYTDETEEISIETDSISTSIPYDVVDFDETTVDESVTRAIFVLLFTSELGEVVPEPVVPVISSAIFASGLDSISGTATPLSTIVLENSGGESYGTGDADASGNFDFTVAGAVSQEELFLIAKLGEVESAPFSVIVPEAV